MSSSYGYGMGDGQKTIQVAHFVSQQASQQTVNPQQQDQMPSKLCT